MTMNNQLRVGSLFAGIGGFDLAAERAGMTVAWQSQWEPPTWVWDEPQDDDDPTIRIPGEGDGRWVDDPQKAADVLAHHWPDVPNYGDIHGITNPPAVDVLTGGFPCQDYSVAGNRNGLAGDRGALWWEYHRLIARLRPTWVVGENVPGLLSSRGGRDFETIVGSLTELGYGVAWAVLDAQYFGVAQRRRRVFIVGHSGGIPRPEVLALSEGVFGHPEPSREAGQDVAGTLAPGSASGGQRSTDLDGHGAWVLQPADATLGRGGLRALSTDTSPTLGAYDPNHSDRGALVLDPGKGGSDLGVEADRRSVVGVVLQEGFGAEAEEPELVDGEGDGDGLIHDSKSARPAQGVKAFAQNQRDEVRDLGDVAGALNAEPGMKQQTYVLQGGGRTSLGSHGDGWDEELSYTLNTTDQHAIVGFKDSRRDGIRIFGEDVSPTLEAQMGTGGNNTPMVDTPTVRRLTPLECERLQGFPDGWTAIAGNSDTQRYRQLGNAVAVPVVEWILKRIGGV